MNANDVRIVKLVTEKVIIFTIKEDSPDYYFYPHYFSVQPYQDEEGNQSIMPNFHPFGAPIIGDSNTKVKKDYIDSKILFDISEYYTYSNMQEIKEFIDSTIDIYMKLISERIGTIITPSSKLII